MNLNLLLLAASVAEGLASFAGSLSFSGGSWLYTSPGFPAGRAFPSLAAVDAFLWG